MLTLAARRRLSVFVRCAVAVLALGVGAAVGGAQTARDIQVVFDSNVNAWPDASKRWALIVGVSSYENPQISPVPGAENDAFALRDALVEYAGFPSDHVLMLTSGQESFMQPGRTNILRDLRRIKAEIPADGLLLFAFAGHGIEREGRAFLIPGDASIIDDVDFLEETAVSLDSLKGLIRGMNAKQVVLLLDACRNDPRAGRSVDGIDGNQMTAAQTGFSFAKANEGVEAFVTLYATAVGYRAWEVMDRATGKARGSFSTALVDGLAGKARNERGEVTLQSLVRYVQEAVPALVKSEYGDDREQRPFVQIGGYRAEELILSRVAEPTLGDDADWALANSSKDVAKLIGHFRSFPGCPHQDEAFYLVSELVRDMPQASVVDVKFGSEPVTALNVSALKAEFSPEVYLEKFPNGSNAAEAHWAMIENSNRAIDFANHIQRYPNSRNAELARLKWQSLMDLEAWSEAQKANTAASYRDFLGRFANSRFSGEAQRALSDLDRQAWSRVRDSRNAADYEKYRAEFPEGDFASDAQSRLEDISAWEKASAGGNGPALEGYIAGHPNGLFINDAYRLKGAQPTERSAAEVEFEAWSQAVTCGEARCYVSHFEKFPGGAHADEAFFRATEKASAAESKSYNFDEYLRRFPNGSFIELAREGIARKAYELIAGGSDPKAYKDFLARFPNTRLAGDAQRMLSDLDRQAWSAARDSRSAADYQTYLSVFPDGDFAADAQRRIEDISAWAKASQGDKAAVQGYIAGHPNGLFINEAYGRIGDRGDSPAVREMEAWGQAVSCGEARCYAEHHKAFPGGPHADEAFFRASQQATGELGNEYSFEKYLGDFPGGAFVELARDGLAQRAFEGIRGGADPQAFRDFLTRFPGSRPSGEAQRMLSDLDRGAWDALGASRDRSAYEKYLADFPEGLYASVARERVADIEAWQAALSGGNEAAFDGYLAKHSSGLFNGEARRKLDELRPPSDAASIVGIPHSSRRDRQEYVWIPAGQFNMGCAPGDTRCKDEEKPQHRVTISKGFWLGATEVDIAAYQRFVDASGGRLQMPSAPLWDKKRRVTNHPITGPSAEEAQAYCQWAGGRLPTEAEWEYAARGGQEDAIYPLNDENSRDKANFQGEEGNDRARYTAPVKSYDPNGFGLFDMAGNVWEWTGDFFDPTYFSRSPTADPKGPQSGQEHVVRGGSWYSDPNEHLRISFRTSFPKGGNLVGFRCVIEDTPAAKELLVGPGIR